MGTRRLGRTGHESSLAILGGAAFWGGSRREAASSFTSALAAGVNHLDVAPSYGAAEELIGPLLPAASDRLFVACKTTCRDAAGLRRELENSLTTLGCTSLDLYQLHAVTSPEVLDAATEAAEELLRVREEGLATWVGITGHELTAPKAHREALRRYDLDTVMFPVNPRLWADPDYRRDAEDLLEHAAENDIGVMAIKAVAARPWSARPRNAPRRTATTWYEPYTDRDEMERNVRFTLSVAGVHAICTPGDLGLLPHVLDCAARFEPMTPEEMTAASAAVAGEDHIFPMPVS